MLRTWKKWTILSGFFIFAALVFGIAHDSSALAQCKQGEPEKECKARLLKELSEKEEEVKRLQQGIQQENAKQSTLFQEIRRINSKIQETSLAIRRKERLISRLRSEISSKEEKIHELNEKLKREKESLARILRRKHELGNTTILEFLLSSKSLSDFYHDVSLFSYIQKSLSSSFKEIDELKREIFEEKQDLEEKKEEHADEKYKLALEKGKVEVEKKDRDVALRVSQSKEATFAQLKKKREEEIKKIRAMLIQFQRNGMKAKSISFGEAYDYAKLAEKYTGVRAAFILAIMQQETGFGMNVGGCYLRNEKTGDGIYIKNGKLAKRTMMVSNIPNFKKITGGLGMDWRKTPVSCALYRNGKYYGYGGAMGYTQFIPNTWMIVTNRVQKYLGSPVASPWNPRDAVMAAAIYLRDKGAWRRNYRSEFCAASSYYAGKCYPDSRYAKSVMARVPKIQQLINTLERD